MTEPTKPAAGPFPPLPPHTVSPGHAAAASATSGSADTSSSLPTATLETAAAQLTALRSQAIVATASGDIGTLRQLAARAAAIGVAAGRDAEGLAGEIAAKLTQATRQQQEGAAAATADPLGQAANRTSLGLDPETITRIFTPGQPAEDQPANDPATAGLASALQHLAGLNAQATAAIGDARTLIATIGASDPALAGGTAQGGDTVSLNGLAELLDQAESQMTARLVAVTQQVGATQPAPGAAAEVAAATGQPSSGLDLKA